MAGRRELDESCRQGGPHPKGDSVGAVLNGCNCVYVDAYAASLASPLGANMTETSCMTVISEQGGKETQHGNDERFCPACNTSDGSIRFDIG